MYSKTFLTKVKTFARCAHETVVFVHSSKHKKPQIEHIQEVADLVWISGGNIAETAAAWLHDAVEDTSTTLDDICLLFGDEVSEIVSGLTDAKEIENLPLLERKTIQAERVKSKSLSVRRIKLADQISNIRYIVTDPPENWPEEKNRDYCIGAKLIAEECKGISPLLDQLFEDQYKEAVAIFCL